MIHQGKASHILPASPDGPNREEPAGSDEACRSQDNGIWLCDIHAREVDDNREKYPAHLLRQWKADAERYVEELVTQDTRLRQLRGMMSTLLSTLRILTALPDRFDTTFENPGGISVTRFLIEAEQILFENGFVSEAERLLRIKDQLEQIYVEIRNIENARRTPCETSLCLDISKWKNQTVRVLMVNIMRFSEKSYRRYLETESAMVRSRLEEFRTSRKLVIESTEYVVEPVVAPDSHSPSQLPSG